MKRLYTLLFAILLFCGNGLNAQTIQKLSATADTYSDGGKANDAQNTINPEQIWVKTGSSASFTRIGYVQFDIAGIKRDEVGTAKLRLFCYKTDAGAEISINDVEGEWSETTLNWNNQPTLIQPAIRSKVIVEGEYAEWNITRLVENAILNGKTTISVALSDATASGKLARFYSKEATDNNKPQLYISSEKEDYQALLPVADALVTGGVNADTNYASATGIQIKNGASTANSDRKGIIKFDLNQIDPNKIATVGTVRLRLYFTTANDNKGANTKVSLLPAGNNWDENAVTWNNFPMSMQTEAIRTTEIDVTKLNQYYEFDISAYAIEKLHESGYDGMLSLAIMDLLGSKNGVTFNSKEAADFKPMLEVLVETSTVPSESAPLTGTFYVDASAGDDANSGSSPETAWKTLDIVNQTTFDAGSRILFKTGQSWTGPLSLKGSGTVGNPIVIASYGSDKKPVIHGVGALETILLENNEYIEVRNLEITNYNPTEENGISLQEWEANNKTEWFDKPIVGYDLTPNTNKVGVRVRAQDIGELNHIYLVNLDIHGINGNNEDKNNGGIFMEIIGTLVPTFYNDYLVEGCHIYDVDRTGMSNTSTWDVRTLTDNGNWTPTLNFNVRNNIFERSGANALILRNAKDPMIEYNLFNQCAIKGSGNAAFNFNTDGAIFQYNEACWTKGNIDDEDAGGLDSDFRTKNTILQYNYVHDNAYGMLATGGGFSTSFNDNTVFRYNIIERDGLKARKNGEKFAFKLSGNITNTTFHNNVIYLSKEQEGIDLMFHKNWLGSPVNTKYYNNIYYIEGKNQKFNIRAGSGTVFSNNTFYAPLGASTPNDAKELLTNPLFVEVGVGPNGYKLQAGSPSIASGKEILGNATMDYFGNAVPATGTLDGGVQQYSATSLATTPGGFSKENFDIYLLIGQSNMAGRGDIENIDRAPLENAYLYTNKDSWENAAVPLNKYSTTRKDIGFQKMNPGYTFAKKLTEYTGNGVGLVVNARGGTSIEQWQKGYTGNEDYNLYEEAVARLLAAKKDGTFKGIIWHQGESNSSSSSTYMVKLKKLVSDLRADLGENVFFVAGELGKWHDTTIPMNNVISEIANDINQASYIKADDLKPINNDLNDPHFNGYSQRILGGLYADEILTNVYNMSPGVASVYSKCDFKGYKVSLNPGTYNLLELQKRGIYDNDINSIEVEDGYEVLLYAGQKEGASVLLSASKKCLSDTDVNKNVSYVVIAKTGGTLAVDKNTKKFGNIKISQNPAKKDLNISFPTGVRVADVQSMKFFDIQGKSIGLKAAAAYHYNNNLKINLEQFNLKTGMYFLVIETPDQVFKKKILIE